MILLRKVLAGTTDNVLPQVLSDVTIDADEAGKCEKCMNNEEYWEANKSWCKSNGCRYSGGGGGANKSKCKQYKCEDVKEYYKSNRSCCDANGWPYESHGTRFGKHKCEDNYEYWQKCESWCKRHGFCPEWYNGRCGSNKDAESIAYIRTGECVGENFHVEDFQDEDFQDEDFKDDPKESQDE